MSEFISNCPKCQQQILCDTTLVGQRVACPICLQEITMPKPASQAPHPEFNISPSGSPTEAQGKRNSLIIAAVIGAIVLIAGAGATLFVLHKNSSGAPSNHPQASTDPLDQCRGLWTCDQNNGGTSVIDTSGNGNNAMLVGSGAAWVKPGKTGSTALSLRGTSYAETPGPVIDTAKSFTVATWVAITDLDKAYNQTIISIDGNQISGFFLLLQPEKAGSRFSFTRRSDDSSSAEKVWAAATFLTLPSTWYHVAGVFNVEEKTITLYVNGELQNTAPCEYNWHAGGKTAIGRGFFEGRNKDFLKGVVCDVRLYDRALTAAEIKALASR